MTNSNQTAVLVVDDQTSYNMVTQATLSKLGFANIDSANSVQDALRKIRSKNYGVIISDWHMSPSDGSDLLKIVKSFPGKSSPKFYFLTMDGSWGRQTTARELGADGVIVKPQRPGELRNRLCRAMGLH